MKLLKQFNIFPDTIIPKESVYFVNGILEVTHDMKRVIKDNKITKSVHIRKTDYNLLICLLNYNQYIVIFVNMGSIYVSIRKMKESIWKSSPKVDSDFWRDNMLRTVSVCIRYRNRRISHDLVSWFSLLLGNHMLTFDLIESMMT